MLSGFSGRRIPPRHRPSRARRPALIARLSGTLHEKAPDRVIIDVQGVGYDVRVPLSTYGSLPATGAEVRLLVHTHVREDAISLYGFATSRERYLFEKMIGVSGVGPRLAIALLSGLPPEDLREAIRAGEVARLCKVPGVGRKTAERLVVDLRDKMEGTETKEAGPGKGTDAVEGPRAVAADVLSALVNLGYPAREAERAVSDARRSLDPEEAPGAQAVTFERLLRDALRTVSGSR
jgi:holliday junction DNA helicase RuvA